ncbi:MAG: PPC domain-containing DNA-binding protein [Polyangiaceae bacterium]
MQLIDAQTVARGMVKVEPGEDLVESIATLARVAGWREAVVSGAGVLELVELTTGGETVTLENAELLSLAGRIVAGGDGPRVALRATVLAGGQTRSGLIAAAMTGGLTLVVDAMHGHAPAARVSDRGLEGGSRGAPAPSPSGPGSTMAAVGAGAPRDASKPPSMSFANKPIVRPPSPGHTREHPHEDDENPVIENGEFLDHPQLGLCEVVGVDAGGGTKIRLSTGKIRVLKLEALKVLAGDVDDEGRMVFRVEGPRRRN